MVKLPGGFSPWQGLQQAADDINFVDGGSRDRDVFSEKYNQHEGTGLGTFANNAINTSLRVGDTGNSQPLNNNGLLGASTSLSGGSGSAGASRQDLDYLSNQEGRYNGLKGLLETTLRQGLTKLDTSETDSRSGAQLQYDRANRGFETKRSDTQLGKQNALGAVDTNARTLADSVRRRLGLASGTGSSAFKFAAPNAIARDASGKRTNVLSSYGQNERDIDTAADDTRVDFDLILKNIANSRKTEEEKLRAGIYGQELDINDSLSQIAAERARLTGGNALSATRPYETRYNELQGELSALPDRFAVGPQRDLQVKQPNLRDYLVDRTAINASNGGQSQYSPYSNFLKPRADDEEELAVR